MLNAESLTPTLKPGAEAAFLQKSPIVKNGASRAQLIEMTYRAVELDGRRLWREPQDVLTGQLVEAVRLADLRDKPELKINDIAPWIAVGSEESFQVPILQMKIQRALLEVCKKLKRPQPECRLDLSHGTYGIRCYLGRTKPSDHIYEEDFVSDSR